MKRFDFPLERVRRWRSEQASLEELKLQQFRAEVEALAAGRREIQEELCDTERQVLGQASIDPLELESLDSYRFHVRARVRDFEQREVQGEAKVVEQRQKVIEARRRFELLDRMRTNKLGAWRAAAAKEQEDLAAELFLARGRRSSG
jgi:hypothetical protein